MSPTRSPLRHRYALAALPPGLGASPAYVLSQPRKVSRAGRPIGRSQWTLTMDPGEATTFPSKHAAHAWAAGVGAAGPIEFDTIPMGVAAGEEGGGR